jgi:hypothetical protein
MVTDEEALKFFAEVCTYSLTWKNDMTKKLISVGYRFPE